MGADDVFISLGLFVAVAAIVIAIAYFRTQAIKARAAGGGDYQRLADETLRGQQALLEEMQRMNASLKEIERLLREV